MYSVISMFHNSYNISSRLPFGSLRCPTREDVYTTNHVINIVDIYNGVASILYRVWLNISYNYKC